MDDKWFKMQQKSVGVTAEDIAREMGRDRSAVSHIYTGQRRMSIEWAQVFAKVLQQPLDEIMRRAGVLDDDEAPQLAPGFSESDATPFKGSSRELFNMTAISSTLGGSRPGIDTWIVRTNCLQLLGYLVGDYMVVDTHKAEKCTSGDIVIAQKYNLQSNTAITMLRRFEPPVLMTASAQIDDIGLEFVDGVNVVVRGKVIGSWRQ